MEISQNIEQLKQINSRLTSLLDAPEPGIYSWWKAVFSVIDELKATVTPIGVDNL